MIVSLEVKIRDGRALTKDQLADISQRVFPNSIPNPNNQVWTQDPYFEQLIKFKAYAFISPRCNLLFIWNTNEDFEIIIYQNNTENFIRVANEIIQKIQKNSEEFKIGSLSASVKSLRIPQTVAEGVPHRPESFLHKFSIDLWTMGVLLILIPISQIYLTNYFEESLAAFVGAFLLLIVKIVAFKIESRGKANSIDWRVKI